MYERIFYTVPGLHGTDCISDKIEEVNNYNA